VKPNGAIGSATMSRHKISGPWQMGLGSPLHKAPLETAHLAVLIDLKVNFYAAANGTRHPFGAEYRAIELGKMVDETQNMVFVPIGMECDYIGQSKRSLVDLRLVRGIL